LVCESEAPACRVESYVIAGLLCHVYNCLDVTGTKEEQQDRPKVKYSGEKSSRAYARRHLDTLNINVA
jgi:hypothetical protein